MGEKYFITTYDVQTKLFMKMEENWIEMRLRYVVEPRKRRAVSHLLVSSILEALEKEEDIMVGTAVGIDLMNSQGEGKQSKYNTFSFVFTNRKFPFNFFLAFGYRFFN